MHKNWRWNLHGHLSLLPFTILYAIACFTIYGARSWGFRNGRLVCIGPRLGTLIPGTGGQTIGGCQVYADSVQIAREDLQVHETGHVVQQMACALIGQIALPLLAAACGWEPSWWLAFGGLLGTPIWGVAYGVCFGVLWLAQRAGWRKAYRANPFEAQCYARQARWLAMSKDERAKVWS